MRKRGRQTQRESEREREGETEWWDGSTARGPVFSWATKTSSFLHGEVHPKSRVSPQPAAAQAQIFRQMAERATTTL